MKYTSILLAFMTTCCSPPAAQYQAPSVIAGPIIPNPPRSIPRHGPATIEQRLDDIDVSIRRLDDILKRGEQD